MTQISLGKSFPSTTLSLVFDYLAMCKILAHRPQEKYGTAWTDGLFYNKGKGMPFRNSTSDLIVLSSHPYGSNEVRTSRIMGQLALKRRIFFIQAPIMGVSQSATYFLKKEENEVTLIQPYLPKECSIFEQKKAQLDLIKELIIEENINDYTLWTDTPRSVPFIRNLCAETIVYDRINNFSPSQNELEKELFQYADLVLTATAPYVEKNESSKHNFEHLKAQERGKILHFQTKN